MYDFETRGGAVVEFKCREEQKLEPWEKGDSQPIVKKIYRGKQRWGGQRRMKGKKKLEDERERKVERKAGGREEEKRDEEGREGRGQGREESENEA